MKRSLMNQKTNTKKTNASETTRATSSQQTDNNLDIWSMSSSDALRINYMDSHLTHK